MIAPETKDAVLPRLREDLRLLPATQSSAGAPHWLVHDPLRDNFYAIGVEGFQLLSHWAAANTAEQLASRVHDEYGREVSEAEVTEMAEFLTRSQLTIDPPGGWRFLARAGQRQSLAQQALHHYLFFKIPLFFPADFLQRTLPIARLVVSKGALIAVALITLAGVYLVSRQWGQAIDDLKRQFNLSGALLFAATLFVMKIFHELGHAYTATAMGVRVRSMGLAFMVLTPMLYTDVTDAWRLPSRRQRVAIDAAGVAVEIAIAGVAMFVWALLPPGDMRDVMLVIAASAWVMSLAINASPFMRYDGYYILCDLIGVKNTQPRAFALARWQLREWLFGFGAPCPDTLRGGMRRLVTGYGFATMIYRLALFVGIAFVVYHMFFKLLGVLLFLVEIAFFIAAPIWREVKLWWMMRAQAAAARRTWRSVAGAIVLLAIFILPWNTQVRVPAVVEPASYARLYPIGPAQIIEVRVKAGDVVKADDVLLVMNSPKLDKELEVTRARLAIVEQRMARRLGDVKDQAASLSLDKERLSLLERRHALEHQRQMLAIRAPISGKIVDLDPDLHKGRQLSGSVDIGVIVGDAAKVIRGYADQEDLWRVSAGVRAKFIPDDAQVSAVPAALVAIAPTASAAIDIPELAEPYGGRVRTYPQQGKGPLAPIDPVHLLTFAPDGAVPVHRTIRGLVIVSGAPQSLLASGIKRALKVLVQEMGV